MGVLPQNPFQTPYCCYGSNWEERWKGLDNWVSSFLKSSSHEDGGFGDAIIELIQSKFNFSEISFGDWEIGNYKEEDWTEGKWVRI